MSVLQHCIVLYTTANIKGTTYTEYGNVNLLKSHDTLKKAITYPTYALIFYKMPSIPSNK